MMEITQIHIPDIPAFKSILNSNTSTSAWQSITDFIENNWTWIVGIIVVGIILNLVLDTPKEDKEKTIQNN